MHLEISCPTLHSSAVIVSYEKQGVLYRVRAAPRKNNARVVCIKRRPYQILQNLLYKLPSNARNFILNTQGVFQHVMGYPRPFEVVKGLQIM